ncbi:hypothetical protein B0H13DRAFT_2549739 [Mycena leptocephala]|nr:hypothetical protein B0H13DRAFT_2549739 [Mycena leptocephala]
MRENHDLHRMLSDTTPARRQLIPFDVVPRTRNCDDASPDREHKRRKIDTDGNGEGVYISRPGSSHDALACPPPLTVPDSPLHPHPHHYDPSPCPCPPTPFSLDPALHLPNSPPGRATYDERNHGAPYAQHAYAHEGSDHGHGYTLPPPFKFSHPHSPVDINGTHNAHEHEHDSRRPYAESERGPGAGAGVVGVGAPL